MTETTKVAIHTLSPKEGDTCFIQKALDDGKFLDTLRDRELTPVITSQSSYKEGGRWLDIRRTKAGVALSSVLSSPDTLGAVYSRVVVPHPYIDELGIAQLNTTQMKHFGKNKGNMVGLLGEYEIPTRVITPEYEPELLFDEADQLVLKPIDGRLGRGFQTFQPAELSARLQQMFTESTYQEFLLQPYVGRGVIPSGVTGVSAEDNEVLNYAKVQSIPAELRLFIIKNGSKNVTVPVMRVAARGTDYLEGNDAYLDVALSDTLEDMLTTNAVEIVDRIAASTEDAQHVIAAVDYLYDGECFWVIEANFRSPTLPMTSTNPHAARSIYPAVADTLYSMSEGGV